MTGWTSFVYFIFIIFFLSNLYVFLTSKTNIFYILTLSGINKQIIFFLSSFFILTHDYCRWLPYIKCTRHERTYRFKWNIRRFRTASLSGPRSLNSAFSLDSRSFASIITVLKQNNIFLKRLIRPQMNVKVNIWNAKSLQKPVSKRNRLACQYKINPTALYHRGGKLWRQKTARMRRASNVTSLL